MKCGRQSVCASTSPAGDNQLKELQPPPSPALHTSVHSRAADSGLMRGNGAWQ